MKAWKRSLLLTAVISGAFTAGVYAQDVLQKVEAYLRPDFKVVLDGQPVTLSTPTLVYDNSSYLPLKELARLLGANILWKEDTKTIFINSRINPEQKPDAGNPDYQKIELYNPYSIKVKYLGAEYPLLLTYNNDLSASYAPYYRLSDVRRMGINTEGLALAKERLTGQLYVSETELKKRWGAQAPTPVYGSVDETYVISDEINPRKLEALRAHVKSTSSFKVGDNQYYDKPIIIDKLSGEDDMYEYLMYETVRFASGGPVSVTYRYHLGKLHLYKKNESVDTTYSVNMISKQDLLAEAEKREDQ